MLVQELWSFLSQLYSHAVFALIFFTYLPESQIIKKKLYLFKQILSQFLLVHTQFCLSRASGKWVSVKTAHELRSFNFLLISIRGLKSNSQILFCIQF